VKAEQSVFAQASYELDFWGKNAAKAHSAEALANASQFDADTLRISLEAAIVDTYFQVLSLQERVNLAQKIAEDASRVLTLVQTQADLGAASNLEVAQQRNALQTLQAAVPALRQQRDQALHQLAVLVGRPPEGFQIEGTGLDGVAAPPIAAGMPSAILHQRPDIQAAEARLMSTNFDIGAARAAFFPDLSLTVQAGAKVLPTQALWSAIGSLSQPLFAGGALEGQLKADRAHAKELAATYSETVLEALQDVENQLTAVDQLDQAYRIDQGAVESAREAARLGQVRFQLGTVDFLNVLTIERTLYQAEDALLQAKLLRLQASVGLFRALGGGFNAAAPVETQNTPTALTASAVSAPTTQGSNP
jgi:NodT family efflux transporter outer membrane factor (OMF) lipoprotein